MLMGKTAEETEPSLKGEQEIFCR